MPDFLKYRPLFIDLLVFITGALLTLAFAPFDLWLLAILLPVVLLWSWDHATPRRAAVRGGLFGLGLFGFGIYWVYISLHDYGNAPAPFAALATFLVVLLMALYPTVVGWLVVRWGPPPGLLRWVLIFPALWTLLDWMRSWLFTGFPWLALGYSQIDSPLGQLAPYLGVFGVGWATLLSVGLLRVLLHSYAGYAMRTLPLMLLASLWLGIWGLGHIHWVEPAGSPLRVAIIQGNIAQNQKWEPDALDATLYRYIQLSLPEHGHSDVIIWPETAIPAFYENVRPFMDALAARAQKDHVDYVTGLPTGSWEKSIFYNSVARIGSDAKVTFYHKRRLLPFGEYLPLRGFFLFFRHWVAIPMADFTAGSREQPLLQAGGQSVGVSICFEAVFGSEIRQALPEATWLINVSNDAWFKDSTAPHQHLQIARMRALEAGRYLARGTNTGISAILDERGQIAVQGSQFQAEVIRGEVQPFHGLTPYARWGDSPAVILVIALLLIGLFLVQRKLVTA
ncbi:MAG TPA: apolipoprotein N-acyltransferase [Candidatus Competibacteraceae bacterium]|nr:apolipoprotein N-acyltransferase [Candidatus Competibacteraceae bacterium]HPF58009.1 apolipoprotein N-acyltransferase [Candidatus Competibacteraceae bacterium]HRY17467.1 apolipoprotein N-acyltransferase [Candidatus Competibacteraceae bacterium]